MYKGEGGGMLNASVKRDRWDLVGNACKVAIVFFILPSQLWNVWLSKLFIQNHAMFKYGYWLTASKTT